MSAIPGASRLSTAQGGTAAMRRSLPGSAVRIAAVAAVVGALFVAGQAPARHWEALAVAGGVRSLGFRGVLRVHGSQILLRPGSGPLFWVDITSSCLFLGPALAVALIAMVISVTNPLSDRLLAGAAGVAGAIAGNLAWIGSSVVVGLLAGRVSLMLFHGWVGSIFGFASTIGGTVLTLSILMRRRRRREGA
jgi:hypothetical protein